MELNNKKIGIDARFYGPKQKGLGRYTKEIVDRIVALDKENEYVIFLSPENFEEFKTDNPNVKKVLASARWYSLAEQISLPRLIAREKLDLIHFPHFNVPLLCRTKFVVTIHDLILTKFPTVKASTLNPFLYWFKNLAYKIVIHRAVHRAVKILAVSQFTKDDLINKFKINGNKIIVTRLGAADIFYDGALDVNKDKEVLIKYGINKRFLLYVGNAYPHKNLEGLIEDFPLILESAKDLQLVLVGNSDYFYERVKEFSQEFDSSGKDFVFPGFVPGNDLNCLYRNASVYIFPSKYEGFGLPPLEAMAQGCPVISSNQASMPEILGDAAIYFNPENENEMIEKILSVINNAELREGLIKKGKEQVKKYDWNKCAEETLLSYSEAK